MSINRGEAVTELIDRWSEAARVYLNGDLRAYAGLAKHAPEYLLMPPYGGDPRRGFDGSDEAVARTAETFRGGHVDVEVFDAYTSGDLAVLVAVERQQGTVGALPPQDWSLRITLVFRREDGEWHCCTDTPTPSPGPSTQSSSRPSPAAIMTLPLDADRRQVCAEMTTSGVSARSNPAGCHLGTHATRTPVHPGGAHGTAAATLRRLRGRGGPCAGSSRSPTSGSGR